MSGNGQWYLGEQKLILTATLTKIKRVSNCQPVVIWNLFPCLDLR